MLSGLNTGPWLEEASSDTDAVVGGTTAQPSASVSWPRSVMPSLSIDSSHDKDSLAGFKSMLDVDDSWFLSSSHNSNQPFNATTTSFHESLLLPPSAPIPSPVPSIVDLSNNNNSTYFFSSNNRTPLASLLSNVCASSSGSAAVANPYDQQNFVMDESLFNQQTNTSNQLSCLDFSGGGGTNLHFSGGLAQLNFDGSDNNLINSTFMNWNRSKLLRPLEMFPAVGAQPTLFQKRVLRQNSEKPAMPVLSGFSGMLSGDGGRIGEKRKQRSEEDELDEASIDGSGLNYDSDDALAVIGDDNVKEESIKAGGNGSNANSTVTGSGTDAKGKKKGLPAKNLMAERRRRKKLNDRLYMLRSVVPKISKMDRASILGDAIEYLKELLQRINDLHNELESTPSSSSLPNAATSSFHPLTPTPLTLPCRVKEELCQNSLPSPNNQQARVEVRVREGRAVNIHMFCARRPGLLLSTMRALDGLGLDIQQAVISCFNGFALDIFRAEQCKEGPGVLPEEIKAVLLHSAGFQNTM